MILFWRRIHLASKYCVVNVCGGLILRMGDILCFEGTNFWDWEEPFFFSLGVNLYDFQEVAFNWNYNIFVFLFEHMRSKYS